MNSLKFVVCFCVWAIISINASSHPAGGGCANRVWRKLNDQKVCFGAAEGTNGKFNAKYGMNIYDFKYVRRDGFLECEYGFGGYFGCEMYPHMTGASDSHMGSSQQPVYHIHMSGHHGHHGGAYYDQPQMDEPQQDSPAAAKSDDVPANDEPQAHGGVTPDRGPGAMYLQQVCVFLTDQYNEVLMPQPPYSGAYFTVPGLQRPAWDTSIELHVYNGPMSIDQNQELHLFHGEDLFNVDVEDNSGNLCVDVYGYGDIVYSQ